MSRAPRAMESGRRREGECASAAAVGEAVRQNAGIAEGGPRSVGSAWGNLYPALAVAGVRSLRRVPR
jgi:hypothetical protein